MPGMGLLRRRAADLNTSSEEALERLTAFEDSLKQGDSTIQLVTERTLLEIKAMLAGQDYTSAFRHLEALDLLLEQQEDAWTALEEGVRTPLMQLVCAAWVTVARRLKQEEQLDSSVLANWKYVLLRASATAQQMISMSSDPGHCSSTPDVLENLVDGQDDEEQDGPAAQDEFNLDSQVARYAELTGRNMTLQAPPPTYARAQPIQQNDRQGDDEDEDDDEDESDDDLVDDVDDMGEGELMPPELTARHGDMPGDLDTGDLQEGGRSGRLVALDDVGMRPVLMRVVARLPEDHEMRQEVEEELGCSLGSEEWVAALDKAHAAAAALGISIPGAPGGGGGGQSGKLTPLPSLMVPDVQGDDVFGVSRDTESPSLAGVSQSRRIHTSDSRLSLFAPQPSSCLLDDGDEAGFKTTAQPSIDMGDSFNSSMLRDSSLMLPPLSSAALPDMPSLSGSAAMAALTEYLNNPAGAAGGQQAGDGARVEFSLDDTSGGAEAYLMGGGSSEQERSAPSPGLWITGTAVISGTGEDDDGAGNDFDAAWLVGDEEGGAEEGAMAAWGEEESGAAVSTSAGGSKPGAKRAASLLSLQPNKMPRTQA